MTTGDVVSAAVFDDAGPFDFYADTITSKGYNYPKAPSGGGGGGSSSLFLQPMPTSYGVNLYDSKTGSTFDLVLNTISLLDYNGGTICASGCTVRGTVLYPFGPNLVPVTATGSVKSGTATFLSSTGDPGTPSGPGTAVTPEPTTLCLVGSGLLGVAAQLRRRKQGAGAA